MLKIRQVIMSIKNVGTVLVSVGSHKHKGRCQVRRPDMSANCSFQAGDTFIIRMHRHKVPEVHSIQERYPYAPASLRYSKLG